VDAHSVERGPASAEAAGPTTDRVVDLVWSRHRQWSIAADTARARLDRRRLWNLALLVIGALAAALSAQTWPTPGVATAFALAAAIALAVAGLVQVHALNADQTARWTLARAASEALKAEIYRYLARVSPYAGPDRAQVLQAQLDVVQTRARDLVVDQQAVPPDGRPLPTLRSVEEYVAARAQGQATWHRDKGAVHARQGRRLRLWQLLATGAGAVLAAATGLVPSLRLPTWTAAATTIAAALGAHLAATQHQRIAAAYAATADQLERLIAFFDPATGTPVQQAQFVADVERVLAVQNEGWADLLSPRPAEPRTGDPEQQAP
jgi:hypothetical protein